MLADPKTYAVGIFLALARNGLIVGVRFAAVQSLWVRNALVGVTLLGCTLLRADVTCRGLSLWKPGLARRGAMPGPQLACMESDSLLFLSSLGYGLLGCPGQTTSLT